MSEAREVAESIFRAVPNQKPETMDDTRRIVRQFMRDETATVVDCVAWELHKLYQRAKQ